LLFKFSLCRYAECQAEHWTVAHKATCAPKEATGGGGGGGSGSSSASKNNKKKSGKGGKGKKK
jgi:hypothetical protein